MKMNHLVVLTTLGIGQANAFSLPNDPIQAYECDHCATLSHDYLSTHWAVDLIKLGHKTMHAQKSKKYKILTNMDQLQQGIAINTLAPGAVIRISPVNPKSNIKPSFQLVTPKNASYNLEDASDLFAKNNDLKDTLFHESVIVFKLKSELGFGKFILKSPMIQGHETDGYIVHVFDLNSSEYIVVSTDKARYKYGDELKTIIELTSASSPIDSVTAALASPDGVYVPIKLTAIGPDMYEGKTTLSSTKEYKGENWYVEATTTSSSSGQTITRQAHTGFSYNVPSAAIREINKQSNDNPLAFVASVEVATGSRYMLQAVIFATSAEGKPVAVETVQSANWLAAGNQQLTFAFTPEKLNSYHKPYYIGHLHLTDYGQLKQVFEYNTLIEINQLNPTRNS